MSDRRSGRPTSRWQLAVIGLAMAGHAVAAQQTTPRTNPDSSPTRITLPEAIRIALRQNYTLKVAANTAALDAAAVRLAHLQFLPSLSATATGSENIGRNFNQSVGVVANQSTQSLDASLASSVTLFNGLQNVASLRQAQYTRDAGVQQFTRAKQTAIFTVTSDYLTLVTDQEELRIEQDNLASQTAQEQQIERLVDAGARAISDLYSQQATVANAQSLVVTAQNTLELARVDLIQALQLDPRGVYEFVTPVVNDSAAARQQYVLDTLLTHAFTQRVDLAAAASQVAAATQGIRSAEGGRWPTLALDASYGSTYTSAFGQPLSTQFGAQRDGAISLALSIPIFDQGAASVATQEARIEQDNAQLALANQRQTVALEVRRAYLNLSADREQLTAARAQLRASDLAVSTTRQRYQVGAATLLELTEAQATQLQAASAVISARYSLVFQEALMSYYTGDLTFGSVAPGT